MNLTIFSIFKIYILISLSTLFLSFADANTPYVDLRDIVEFNDEDRELAQMVENKIRSSLCDFISPVVKTTINNKHLKSYNLAASIHDLNLDKTKCNTEIQYSETGAVGPNGRPAGNSYKIVESNIETRKNSILSVEFDGLNWKTQINPNKHYINIILFIHDETQHLDSKGYYFRKIKLIYNRIENQIIMDSITQDVPLKNTRFSFFTDIVERKTVLWDSINGITKVFPVAVGSLDVRTFDGMDEFVGSMTVEMKSDARIYLNQPSGLYQTRLDPWYYKGRPFLGVMDDSGQKYKEIGYHYKIDEGDLVRGFVTHGCVRVRDKDLYQMEAIVFSGEQDFVPVQIVNSFIKNPDLIQFSSLTHPFPKQDVGFNFLAYAEKDYLSENNLNLVSRNIGSYPNSFRMSEVEQYLWCHQNGIAQPIRYFENWASALDEYCLTKIAHSNQNIIPFIDYILGSKNSEAKIEPLRPIEPNLIEGLCKKSVDLNDAVKIYSEEKNRDLTFGIYVDHCGCQRFKLELGNRIFKDTLNNILTAKDVYKNYCG